MREAIALARAASNGGQIGLPEAWFGVLRCIVVPPAFRRPVPDEMLDAGRDALLSLSFCPDKANVGARNHAAEVRIFAGSVHDAEQKRVSRRCQPSGENKMPSEYRRGRSLGRDSAYFSTWNGSQVEAAPRAPGEGRQKSVNSHPAKHKQRMAPGSFTSRYVDIGRGRPLS